MTTHDLPLDEPITSDELVAEALERAATDLLHQAEDLDVLPLADVYRRSALAVTAMLAGVQVGHPADQLVDAVHAARARYVNLDVLSDLILDGDPDALVEGLRIQAEINEVGAALDPYAYDGGSVEVQFLAAECLVDAVLVATGEQPSADPEINERFKPARLEWSRRWAERHLAEIDTLARERTLTGPEVAVREQCVIDLGLIAQGVEPS